MWQARPGIIQQLLAVFEQAFHSLHIPVSFEVLEKLAITVHRSMSMEARHFHTPEHILHLVDDANPIQSLAALFHDIVYYQVDRGFSPEIFDCISPYILVVDGEVWLVEAPDQEDRLFRITAEIFGFSPGQKLSTLTGSNEFMSALVMAKCLEGFVPVEILLKIIVYIEATIPFRRSDPQSREPFEGVAARMQQVIQAYHIQVDSTEVDEVIRGAVTFANRDVESFAEHDPSVFLDGTWKLLPETNVALRSRRIYSIKEYRHAIEKMGYFMDQLNPYDVFHQYKGVPPEDEYHLMVELAIKNVVTARAYLAIKLLALAVIEALADLTGGDAPLSLFTGEIQAYGEGAMCYEDFLPVMEPPTNPDPSSAIYQLLATGRASEIYFDMRNSPLALFLYRWIPKEKIPALLAIAKKMFSGNLEPLAFLKMLDAPLVTAVAKASAAAIITRQDKLTQLVLEFQAPA